MKTSFAIAFLLSAFLFAQRAHAQSCAADSLKRQDTCGDLVKPYPHGRGCRARGTCGSDGGQSVATSKAPSGGAPSSGAPSSGAPSSRAPSSGAPSSGSATGSTPAVQITTAGAVTTIKTSEGVCTCTCDSSTPGSETSDDNSEYPEYTDGSSVGVSSGVSSGVTGGASSSPDSTDYVPDYTDKSSVGVSSGVSSGVTGGVSSSSGSGTPVECELTDYLYNISILLSGEDYELFIEWIYEIRVTIISDSSLSYNEIVVKIAYSMKAFFEAHIEIQEVLYYEMLGSWGFCIDFIYVGYQIQISITEEIITLDASGSCALFEALRNATAGDAEKSAAVEKLIAQITAVLKSSSLTYTQQQAQIYLLFVQFFQQHSQWESFFFSIQIEGFGLFEYYYDVTFWYHQITTISVVIGGDVSSCVLVQALYNAYQNSSYSVSVRAQFKQLYGKIQVYFASNTDISLRLKYLVSECYSLWQLSAYMEVYVDELSCGLWGYIYDIIFCSNICINDGCDNIDDGSTGGPTTATKASSAIASSTAAQTTVKSGTQTTAKPTTQTTAKPTTQTTAKPTTQTTAKPTTQTTAKPTTQTTAKPATSTVAPANCATRWSMLQIQVSTNTTYFTAAVQAAYDTWDASTKASFNTYKNQIWGAVYNKTASHQQIFSQVITSCGNFNKNNAAKQQILYNVTITQWRGTVGQFVGCGSTCGC